MPCSRNWGAKRMDKKIIEARLRQLLAIDRNAEDIYGSLAKEAADEKMRIRLQAIAADETRHVAMLTEALTLLLSIS